MSTAIETPSVEAYFEEAFVGRHLADATTKSVKKYLCVIQRTSDYLGRPLQFDDLSDKLTNGLTEWLTSQGMQADRVQVYRQCLRALAADAQQHGVSTGWISSRDPLANPSKGFGNRHQRFKRDTRGPSGENRRKLTKAAALFAGGLKLADVAERLGESLNTLSTWRRRYRSTWDAAYQKASSAVIESVRVEAEKRAAKVKEAAYIQRATSADRMRRQATGEVQRDPGESGTSKRLEELIVDLQAERAWGQGTAYQYRCTVESLERWSGRTLCCHEFEVSWVNQYLAELDGSHLAKPTIRSRRIQLVALWRAAFDAGLCPEPPNKVRRVKIIQRPPEAWSHAEMEELLKAASRLTGRYCLKDPATGESHRILRSVYWRAFVRCLWDSGLRSGDALQISVGDIGDGGIMQLSQGKTGRWHVCKFHPSTLTTFAALKLPQRSRLLPWGKSGNYLRQEFRDGVAKSAGLVGTMKKIRKSSASDVELHHPGMGGVHLGHRLSASISHNHYLDPRIVAKNRPMPTELRGDL